MCKVAFHREDDVTGARMKHVNCIGLCSVLRPRQHSIGYMGDGFYRSKDPTNSIEVLKEKSGKENNPQKTERKHKLHICIHTQNSIQIQRTLINTASPLVHNYMG